MSQNTCTSQTTLSRTSLFWRLRSFVVKLLSHLGLATGTPTLREDKVPYPPGDDAAGYNLLSSGGPAGAVSLDKTIRQPTSPEKLHTQFSYAEVHSGIAHRHTKAELHGRKQLVEARIRDCLTEVEAAKKHYVESQRAFFQANDEKEELERLIGSLEEGDIIIQPSREYMARP